jgi:hypothetical protein
MRNVEVMLCIKRHCGLETAALPREVLGVDTALPGSESPRKSPTAHVVKRETVTRAAVLLDLSAPTRAGDDVYIDTNGGQCGGQMPTVSRFAPPTGRNLVGGNQHLQRPVTPESETLVPATHPRVTEPSMPACRDDTGWHPRSPRYIDPILI